MAVLEPGCGGAVARDQKWFRRRLTKFTVVKSGTTVYVRTPWNASSDLVQHVHISAPAAGTNDVVNLAGVRLIPIATAASATGTAFEAATGANILAAQGDDAGPPEWNGQRSGGNHGPQIIQRITATSHGKQPVDVGSLWTDGGAKVWTLIKIVDADTMWFMPPNTGTATVWNFNTSRTGTTLTHSSGATNTGTITVASSDVTTQLRPVQNRHTKTLLLDGVTTTADGTYSVRACEIVESYDIPNQASGLAYIRAGVGSDPARAHNDEAIPSQVRMFNVTRFAYNGSCVVDHTFTALQELNMNLGYVGPSQATVLSVGAKTLLEYIPRLSPWVGTVKTWDFANVEDITGTFETWYLTTAKWASATVPPDRMCQFIRNGATNETGFVIGISEQYGTGVRSLRTPRLQLAYGAGFMSSGKKNYPNGYSSIGPTFAAGESGTVRCYRIFYPMPALSTATVHGWYFDGDTPVVMADFHGSVSGAEIPVPSQWAGARVKLIDTDGTASLGASRVSATGTIPVSTTTYGAVKLRLLPP